MDEYPNPLVISIYYSIYYYYFYPFGEIIYIFINRLVTVLVGSCFWSGLRFQAQNGLDKFRVIGSPSSTQTITAKARKIFGLILVHTRAKLVLG